MPESGGGGIGGGFGHVKDTLILPSQDWIKGRSWKGGGGGIGMTAWGAGDLRGNYGGDGIGIAAWGAAKLRRGENLAAGGNS